MKVRASRPARFGHLRPVDPVQADRSARYHDRVDVVHHNDPALDGPVGERGPGQKQTE